MNQADMSQDIRESLSAGIDGELSREQLRFLLRRLDHDAALQDSWARYHIARDGLRRQLPAMASGGFSARVMAAIEQEAAPQIVRRNHWLRWSAGGAIAASVAAVALMVGQPTGDAGHVATLAGQPSATVAQVAPASGKPTTPAAVPPWLSGNSAGLLSQQASATLGAPLDQGSSVRGLSSYPPLHRYRTLDNNDGSYLLLLEPERQPGSARQAATNNP